MFTWNICVYDSAFANLFIGHQGQPFTCLFLFSVAGSVGFSVVPVCLYDRAWAVSVLQHSHFVLGCTSNISQTCFDFSGILPECWKPTFQACMRTVLCLRSKPRTQTSLQRSSRFCRSRVQCVLLGCKDGRELVGHMLFLDIPNSASDGNTYRQICFKSGF